MPLQKGLLQFFGQTPRGIALIVGISVALIFAGSAYGSTTFPDACGGANNFDYAVCERVDYLAQREDDNDQIRSWILGVILFTATVPIWRKVFVGA